MTVLVGDEFVGAVMSDLSGRRGRVVGTEQAGGGRARSSGPRFAEIEIGRYAVDLRSLWHGTARFNRTYARHEPMPSQIAERMREQARTPGGASHPRRAASAASIHRRCRSPTGTAGN